MTEPKPVSRRLLPEPATLTSTSVNTLIAGAGPGIMALAGTGSPWAIAVGVAGPWIRTGVEALYGEVRARRLNRAAEVAASDLQTDAEGLGQRIIDAGEPVIPFTIEVIEALIRTADEGKIDALARVWAHGIGDPASIDQDTFMVKSLAQIEGIHIATLSAVHSGSGIVDEVSLYRRLDHYRLLLPSAIGTLVQLGFLAKKDAEILPGPAYIATTWGGLALDYLRGTTAPGTVAD